MARRISTDPTPARVALASRIDLGTVIDAVCEHWATDLAHTEQTRTRMTETVRRLEGRLVAIHIEALEAVTPQVVEEFVHAPTRHGSLPALATQHARRTAVRTFFRTARFLGYTRLDPTLDVALPARGSTVARPLTDDEVVLCRASALTTSPRVAGIRATAWALGEATAVSSEITSIRIRDFDNPASPSRVRLPGTRRHDPRTAALTEWGAVVLAKRVAHLRSLGNDHEVLLAYGGCRPPGGAKAQAAVCMALRAVMDAAGLGAEADVRPASLRNWAGRRLHDAGVPIDAVARALGSRTLDSAAEDIGLRWRQEHP